MVAARLPLSGQDEGTWGDVLNDFLKVEHNTDGSLKRGADIDQAKADAAQALTTAQQAASGTIADGSVTTAKLANGAVTDVKVTAIDAAKITTGVLNAARIPNLSTTYAPLASPALTGSPTIGGKAIVVADDARLPSLTGAVDGYIPVYDSGTGRLVLQPNTGNAVVVTLLGTALANGAVFTSDPYDCEAPSPNRTFGSTRLVVTANASYTAVSQVSTNALSWTSGTTYTVTSASGTFSVDQTVAPTARYIRWVITATAAGMTTMNAKVTLS